MDSRPSSIWRRIGEILRWRGFGILFLLGVRNILRPIVYWHVYRIFATDIATQVPEPYAKEKIETKIYTLRFARQAGRTSGDETPRCHEHLIHGSAIKTSDNRLICNAIQISNRR
jgi:hypothetical protein